MPVTWLKRIAGTAAASTMLCFSGCYNMNGYMLNASGMNLYDQGSYAQAAQEFQTAVANNPHNPDYVSNLAKARMKLGDAAGAEQLFRQALVTDPGHQPSYHGLGELMLAQGRNQEAGQMLQTWSATQPYVAESHVEMAWLQKELGQHELAAQSLQQALQVNPNHPTALSHLGQYYQDNGQPQQAVAMYQRSLQSDWDQPHVHNRLAAVAQAAGPSHPMSQIAMARGVHPHSIPRQQLALGPAPMTGPPTGFVAVPNGGMQNGMAQPHMNVAGQMMAYPAPGYPVADGQAAGTGYPTVARQSLMPPIGFGPSPSAAAQPYPGQQFTGQPYNGQPWQPFPSAASTSPLMVTPNPTAQVAGFPAMFPGMMGTGAGTTNIESSTLGSPDATQQVRLPSPDPFFESLPPIVAPTSSVPVSGVSQSRVIENDLVELDAF